MKAVVGRKGTYGTVLSSLSYSRDNGGDRALLRSVADQNSFSTTTYSYDVLNRLSRARTTNSLGGQTADYQYAYDPNSNRTSQTIDGITTNYTHNAADQLTSAGQTTFSYDGNGNETSNSAGRQWSYNAKDQATSVTPPGGSAIPMSYTGAGQFKRGWRSRTELC